MCNITFSESADRERAAFDEKVKREREEERKFWETKIDGKIEGLFYDEKTRLITESTAMRHESKSWVLSEVCHFVYIVVYMRAYCTIMFVILPMTVHCLAIVYVFLSIVAKNSTGEPNNSGD